MAIHGDALEMTASHIGIYVSQHGEKFPTAWHAIECLGWNSVRRNSQGTWWPTKETIWDYTAWTSLCKIPQGKPCGTMWVNYTYTAWRYTHMVQHVEKLLTWSPTKEIMWDCMWWNSPHRNPQGRPCGRYRWLKFYTGSHVGDATFPYYILPYMGSRVSFINPRPPTRFPSWVPTRVISSYTVLYG